MVVEIGIGLLGLGGVGSGVARYFLEEISHPSLQLKCPLTLHRILVRDTHRPRSFTPRDGLMTTDAQGLLRDPRIHLVVELLGGEHPALEYISQALESGKHVVTANKEVMAKHGAELLALASRGGTQLLFEASVGAGIPIVGPLQRDLRANEIVSVRAIINGTTNYILTKMAQEEIDFPIALAQAQQLGYAESDPTDDLEGIDAAYKLAILASLAFRTRVHSSDVYREGISHLHAKDFRYAHELGYEIKLLAIGRKKDSRMQLRVHPALLPLDTPLARVEGAFNAIEIHGDLIGPVVFSGQGAGTWPTTSAIVGDILAVAEEMTARGRRSLPAGVEEDTLADPRWDDQPLAVRPIADLITRYYLRLNVMDRPGVLAQITTVLGEHQIGLASVIQKDADAQAGTAEIVITTHPAQEEAMQQAAQRLRQLPVVSEFANLIRMETG